MKALALIFTLSTVVLAKECPKNHIDGPAGPCSAYMPPALGASADESAKWVSDEKPPSEKMPSYEREGITVSTATNMAESDRKWDESVAREMSTVGKKGSK